MTNYSLDKELDPNPLVASLTEKTKAGKLKWEATSAENTYIVSLGGGTTLRIYTGPEWSTDEYGNEVQVTLPRLNLINEKGLTLWSVSNYDVKVSLWGLFKLAGRVANKLDERVADLMGYLEKL